MAGNDYRVYDEPVSAAEKPRFVPPDDQYIAVCCDVVNLGLQKKDNSRYNKPDSMVKKCRVDFLIPLKHPETGQFVRISQFFTVSLGEKANLRKFMEQWRGKQFTPEELEAGIVIDKMIGAHALITIEAQKNPATGKTYSNITAITKVPAMMREEAQKFPVPKDYVRMKDRKQEDGSAPPHGDDDRPGALDEEDDDLPF